MENVEILQLKLRESADIINSCHSLLDQVDMPRTSRDNRRYSLEERISILVDIKKDDLQYSLLSKLKHFLRKKLYF